MTMTLTLIPTILYSSEDRDKIVQGWHPENETVTFYQNRTWKFEATLSNGSLEDMVTSLNPVAVVSP
jgi:hypothetical protein